MSVIIAFLFIISIDRRLARGSLNPSLTRDEFNEHFTCLLLYNYAYTLAMRRAGSRRM